MSDLTNLEARVRDLEKTVNSILAHIKQLPVGGGNYRSIDAACMDGANVGRLADLIIHGKVAKGGSKVDKFCIRFQPGQNGAYGCNPALGTTGVIGMSLGINGKFLSEVDGANANTTYVTP